MGGLCCGSKFKRQSTTMDAGTMRHPHKPSWPEWTQAAVERRSHADWRRFCFVRDIVCAGAQIPMHVARDFPPLSRSLVEKLPSRQDVRFLDAGHVSVSTSERGEAALLVTTLRTQTVMGTTSRHKMRVPLSLIREKFEGYRRTSKAIVVWAHVVATSLDPESEAAASTFQTWLNRDREAFRLQWHEWRALGACLLFQLERDVCVNPDCMCDMQECVAQSETLHESKRNQSSSSPSSATLKAAKTLMCVQANSDMFGTRAEFSRLADVDSVDDLTASVACAVPLQIDAQHNVERAAWLDLSKRCADLSRNIHMASGMMSSRVIALRTSPSYFLAFDLDLARRHHCLSEHLAWPISVVRLVTEYGPV